jgi:tripartite-type tricarboxylate transporter receptor subunit TctC
MRSILLAAAAAFLGGGVEAQTYPTRSVEIVVPYGPGGTGDVIARQLARKLEARFRQPFVVLNKPGAVGALGAGLVARSEPNGYTLLLGYTSEVAIAPSLGQASYEVTDFEPIALAGTTPLVLVGTKTLPAGSFAELVETFRSRPDQFSYASAGNGSPAHIAGELLNRDAKIGLRHVPYRGGAQAVNDVVGGHVAVYFSGMPPAVPLVQSGDLKAFFVTGPARSPALPNVPTAEEAKLPGFDLSGWFAFLAPRGLPPHILQQLREASREALQDSEIRAALAGLGVEARPIAEDRVADYLAEESSKYRRLVAALGIKAGK